MFSFRVLRDIQPGEYWALDDPARIYRMNKPGWICSVSQVWEFAKVMHFAKTKLEDNDIDLDTPWIVKPAIANLERRYEHLLASQSFFAEFVTAIFLWVMGYREQNSLEEMMTKIRSYDPVFNDPLSVQWRKQFSQNLRADPNADLELLKKQYALGPAIEPIHQYEREDKRVGLMVGSLVHQWIPGGNINWVSGTDEMVYPIPEKQPPLWLDFNQEDALEPLNGLFDQIVIRPELVGKGERALNGDFAQRFAKMLTEEGEMIIPIPLSYSTPTEEKKRSFDKDLYRLFIPARELFEDSSDIIDSRKEYLELFEKHLKTLFENVALTPKPDDFPPSWPDFYFLVTHPKKEAV